MWENVEGGAAVLDPVLPRRLLERTTGSTRYVAAHRPYVPGTDTRIDPPATVPAVFLRLPISGIEVVRDRSARADHLAKLKRLDGCALDVHVEEE